MSQERRPLFREYALQHYMQRREKDILPRVVSPPIFLFCWIFLALLLCVGIISWLTRVPIFIGGRGVIATQELRLPGNQSQLLAIVFVPVRNHGYIRQGAPVHVQIGSSGPSFSGTIVREEPGILSPAEAQRRYDIVSTFSEPSVALDVSLNVPASIHIYPGIAIDAQVEMGTRRVLTLFPGFDRLMGDN